MVTAFLRATSLKIQGSWDFLGGPVVKIACSQSRGPSFNPGQGARSHTWQLKMPCAAHKTWHSQLNK